MKFLATSDLHGYLPKIDTPFDLLMICGDICPAQNHYYTVQMEWLNNEFINWINNLPFKTPWSKVILVWGNHDFVGERITRYKQEELELKTNNRLKILRHDTYDFEYPVSDGLDTLKIFGTPYCSLFGHWPFMVNDETLEKKFSQIPEDTDILLSHDSPNIYKIGAILEGPWKNEDTGNKILSHHIERIKPIIFHSGHFHSGNHAFEERNGIWMANVSYVNEDYEPKNKVLEYDFDEETKTVNKKAVE